MQSVFKQSADRAAVVTNRHPSLPPLHRRGLRQFREVTGRGVERIHHGFGILVDVAGRGRFDQVVSRDGRIHRLVAREGLLNPKAVQGRDVPTVRGIFERRPHRRVGSDSKRRSCFGEETPPARTQPAQRLQQRCVVVRRTLEPARVATFMTDGRHARRLPARAARSRAADRSRSRGPGATNFCTTGWPRACGPS